MLWLTNCLLIIFSTSVSSLINGKEVDDLKLFPHHVFLKVQNETGDQYYCGGAILSSKFIVTSKHCVKYVSSLQVIGKSLSPQDTSGLYINITDISLSIISTADLNEFALIKLPKRLKFSELIKPIRFIESNLEWGGTHVTIAGLDTTNSRSVFAYAEFEVIPTGECGSDHGTDFLGPSFKCFSNKEGIDLYPCFGNLGEAVLIEDERDGWRIVGVVAKSDTCATKLSGIFSNIQETTLIAISDLISSNK